MKKNNLVGCCGIACHTCGLFVKKICLGCEKTQEAVDKLNEEEVGCPVLECAVEKKKEICSRDCKNFPCEKFDGWPLSGEWLGMFKARNKDHE